MATKLNPRRRPATQADVDRARTTATAEAMKRYIELVLFVLIDKHDAPKEIKRLQRWVNNKFIWRSCERFEDYK